MHGLSRKEMEGVALNRKLTAIAIPTTQNDLSKLYQALGRLIPCRQNNSRVILGRSYQTLGHHSSFQVSQLNVALTLEWAIMTDASGTLFNHAKVAVMCL